MKNYIKIDKIIALLGIALIALMMLISVNTITLMASDSEVGGEAPCPQWCNGGKVECGQSHCGRTP